MTAVAVFLLDLTHKITEAAYNYQNGSLIFTADDTVNSFTVYFLFHVQVFIYISIAPTACYSQDIQHDHDDRVGFKE